MFLRVSFTDNFLLSNSRGNGIKRLVVQYQCWDKIHCRKRVKVGLSANRVSLSFSMLFEIKRIQIRSTKNHRTLSQVFQVSPRTDRFRIRCFSDEILLFWKRIKCKLSFKGQVKQIANGLMVDDCGYVV